MKVISEVMVDGLLYVSIYVSDQVGDIVLRVNSKGKVEKKISDDGVSEVWK